MRTIRICKCLILLEKLILDSLEPMHKLLFLLKFFYYATAISILSFSLMSGTNYLLYLSKGYRCTQIDDEKDRGQVSQARTPKAPRLGLRTESPSYRVGVAAKAAMCGGINDAGLS